MRGRMLTDGPHVTPGTCGWVEDWPEDALPTSCGREAVYTFTSAINGRDFAACVDHAAAERAERGHVMASETPSSQ